MHNTAPALQHALNEFAAAYCNIAYGMELHIMFILQDPHTRHAR